MSDDRWRRVEELYHAGLGVSPERRATFLEDACGGDSELRREVESLLVEHKSTDSVFDRPAWTDSRPSDQSVSRAEALLAPGAVLGPYRITGLLGEGGMGQVYRAHDSRLQRSVAIKVLFPEQDVRRFEREARAVAALSHPNVVPIFDVGHDNGVDYLVEELVEGESLRDLLRRGPLEVARFRHLAGQIAEGLAAAHHAGIIHRDLKPRNIMVSSGDCARILDFGLATSQRVRSDDATLTLPHLGAVIGTAAYMSPEQVQGNKIDTRSDIFSYGALLYEMITGRRAFARDTLTATLAAVLQDDPPQVGEIVAGVPDRLAQLIHKCLSKDSERRFQSIDDVRSALDLQEDTNLSFAVRPHQVAPRRRWLWPAVAAACVAIAPFAVWIVTRLGPPAPAALQLVRATPDDGYSYTNPAISPDGKFVAAISNRSGTKQVWLQQVGGGDPIQITDSPNPVQHAWFFPDGTRLLVKTGADDGDTRGNSALEVLPMLGGQSRVAATGGINYPALSPDGRHAAYMDYSATASSGPFLTGKYHLTVVPTDGGTPRVLDKWANTQAQTSFTGCTWTADSQHLLVLGSKRRGAANLDEWEWFVLPVDGGDPVPTGAGDAIRAAGLGISSAGAIAGDRVLFASGPNQRRNVWEIRLTPGSWRVAGAPRQLTFGTETERPTSVSAAGIAAVQISHDSYDFYLISIDPNTGQPAGSARRLTQDGRSKRLWPIGGDPSFLYFRISDVSGSGPVLTLFSLDLTSSKQTELNRNLPMALWPTISPDGRQVAYSRPEGDGYVIILGAVGSPLETARTLCRDCGRAVRFTPDGRYLICMREASLKANPKQKYSTALVEVASGKLVPWLEDPAESVKFDGLLTPEWALIGTQQPGDTTTERSWLVRWRAEPIPRSEWIEFQPPAKNWNYWPVAPFLYGFQNSRLMATRFDAKQRRMSEPFPLRFAPGSPVEFQSTDVWYLRGPGFDFSRQQTSGSVWLMKLP